MENSTDLHLNDENENLRSRWDIWALKNARPKNHYFPKPKRSATRFQKQGPMTEGDWKRFQNWVMKRALPKRVFHQLQERKTKPLAKVMRRIPLRSTRIKAAQERKRKRFAQIMTCTQRLSVPKHQRGKYEAPPEPIYPFSPKIHYKKPPHHDRGRPFQPITLPYWWSHEELEMEFWRWMRFPISQSALKYRITRSTRRMAVPKKYPVKEHCNVPDKDFSPPERVKMTPKEWREHLRHLEHLADASFKGTRQVHYRCQPKSKDHSYVADRELSSERSKMTAEQWQRHLQRLKHLADASCKTSRQVHKECKPEADRVELSERVKMTAKERQKHLQRLEYLADASFKTTRQVHNECKTDADRVVSSERVKMTEKERKKHLQRLEHLADASFKTNRQVHSQCRPEP